LATSSEDAPEAGSVARLRQPSGRSVAVDLQPGDTQTRDAVRLYRALPSEEFLDRQLVAAADFLKADGPVAHGVDYYGLAPCDPAFCVRGWQVDDGSGNALQDLVSGQVVQPSVLVHGGRINRKILKNP